MNGEIIGHKRRISGLIWYSWCIMFIVQICAWLLLLGAPNPRTEYAILVSVLAPVQRTYLPPLNGNLQ